MKFGPKLGAKLDARQSLLRRQSVASETDLLRNKHPIARQTCFAIGGRWVTSGPTQPQGAVSPRAPMYFSDLPTPIQATPRRFCLPAESIVLEPRGNRSKIAVAKFRNLSI